MWRECAPQPERESRNQGKNPFAGLCVTCRHDTQEALPEPRNNNALTTERWIMISLPATLGLLCLLSIENHMVRPTGLSRGLAILALSVQGILISHPIHALPLSGRADLPCYNHFCTPPPSLLPSAEAAFVSSLPSSSATRCSSKAISPPLFLPLSLSLSLSPIHSTHSTALIDLGAIMPLSFSLSLGPTTLIRPSRKQVLRSWVKRAARLASRCYTGNQAEPCQAFISVVV